MKWKITFVGTRGKRIGYIDAPNEGAAWQIARGYCQGGEYVGGVTKSNSVYAAFGRRWYK